MFETILAFMDKGGNVLWVIATLVLFMWTLIIERFIYFYLGGWSTDRSAAIDAWESRAEWILECKADSQKVGIEARDFINENMSLIATCVALCPLLGLLGTVTGLLKSSM